MTKRLKVAINAQLMPDGPSGGTVTVLRALAALAELGGSEDYVFIGPHEDPEWLRPLLPRGQRIVRGPQFMSPSSLGVDPLEPFKSKLGPLRPLARAVKRFLTSSEQGLAATVLPEPGDAEQCEPVASREFFQSLGCDVIHFPFQSFSACSVPVIYNPHDLQHLHLPEFFTTEEIALREKIYPAACRAAHTVVVASQFVKGDVIERYGVEAKNVQVIPWAPPPLPKSLQEGDGNFRSLRQKYELAEGPFILYPAMTWQHKNHLRLLEAAALLRDREGLQVQLICTGFKTEFWPHIERRLSELGLTKFVKFPGLVSLADLHALYRAAQFVFVPTLFEAASAPVFEAWQHGKSVACSRVTSLPEQVADAALLFDPLSTTEIASALACMITDDSLRADLEQRGKRRLQDFSLERTAKAYRAVYRRAAGQELKDEERRLLDLDWMRQPENKARQGAAW